MEPAGKLFIIRYILLILCLGDKYMSHRVSIQKLLQSLKIMGLIAFKMKPLYHMDNHVVIVSPHFIAGVFLGPEIAGDAKIIRTGEYHGRHLVGHSLWDSDLSLKSLLLFAVKMDKAAHGAKQAPGNGEPQSKPSGEAAASGIRLVKVVAHLGDLGAGHADSGVADIYDQIDAIAFFSIYNGDIDSALFRKFDGIFQKNLEDMGNFFHIADENRRHFGVQIKYHLQLMLAVLHGGHGNDVVKQRVDHVRFVCRGQSSLHDLRVVQHVVDLVGQALSCHLYGIYVRPDFGGDIFFQYHFADPQNHVDGSPELMRHVGEKLRVLPA